ncbi:MAG: zinc ribbon domain-containing protein [Pseudomonadota bacterium]
MSEPQKVTCPHCPNTIKEGDTTCPHCGMPIQRS